MRTPALLCALTLVGSGLLGIAPAAAAPTPTPPPAPRAATADASVPVVSAVEPVTGVQRGREPVTITGSGFQNNAIVLFGGVQASDVQVVSATTITAITPPGAGTEDVVVRGPQGTSATSSADRFTYTAGAGLITVGPVRVLDTRTGTGAPRARVGAGGTVTVDLSSRVPAGASAVVLTLTGVEPTASTHLTAYPGGTALPDTSSLNLPPKAVLATQVTVAVGATRTVSVFNAAGSIDVVADLIGYDSTGGPGYQPVGPTRLLDTRTHRTPLGPKGSVTISVDPGGTVPSAAVITLTGVAPSAGTYLTAYAGPSRPATSSLNLAAGSTLASTVTTAVSSNDTITIYNSVGTTNVVVDLVGVYVPGTTECTCVSTLSTTTPTRVLDTRSSEPVGPGGTVAVDVSSLVPIDTIAVIGTLTGVEPTRSTDLVAYSGQDAPATSNLNLPAHATYATEIVTQVTSGRFTVRNAAGSINVVFDLIGYERYTGVAPMAAELPVAHLGTAYTGQLEATGGRAPYSWAVSTGSLPPGLAIHGTQITGTPTAAGSYTAALAVTDAGGESDGESVTIESEGTENAAWAATSAPVPYDEVTDPLDSYGFTDKLEAGLGHVSCPTTTFCGMTGSYSAPSGSPQLILESGAPGALSVVAVTVPSGEAGTGAPISCPAAGSCLAILDTTDSAGDHPAYVDELSGGTWTQHAVPLPPDAPAGTTGLELNDVQCTAAGSCELVGSLTQQTNDQEPSGEAVEVAYRLGTATTQMLTPTPDAGSTLTSAGLEELSCPTTSFCAAVGGFSDQATDQEPVGHELFAETDDGGTTWTVDSLAADQVQGTYLEALSCWAAQSCVALGDTDDSPGGGLYANVLAPPLVPGHGTLTAEITPGAPDGKNTSESDNGLHISCVAGGTCTVPVAKNDDGTTDIPYVLVRSGGSWTATDLPTKTDESPSNAEAQPSDLDCTSVGNCVVIGGVTASWRTEIWTDVNGTWSVADTPLPDGHHDVGIQTYTGDALDRGFLSAVSCPSDSSCVAVGLYGVLTGVLPDDTGRLIAPLVVTVGR